MKNIFGLVHTSSNWSKWQAIKLSFSVVFLCILMGRVRYTNRTHMKQKKKKNENPHADIGRPENVALKNDLNFCLISICNKA